MGSVLTLAELVRKTGVTRSTVQFYTRRGLLPPPAKTSSGRCLYSEKHAELLRRIAECKARGYSIAAIQKELGNLIECAGESESDLAAQEHERIRHLILRAGIEEFVSRGYEHVRLASVIRKAGVTPYVFRGHFASKAQLLVECFNAFIKWNAVLVGPQLARASDLNERLLHRLTGNVRAQALAADVQMVVRSGRVGDHGEVRRTLEEAWGRILAPVTAELATLRPKTLPAPTVPGELIVLGLTGAFDATYMRSIWDDAYGLTDLLLAHLWLYSAVQAALGGEVDIDARLAGYSDLIREVATYKPEVLSSLEAQGYDHARGRILHAATVEFMNNGYEGAHVSTITQEAGVTPHVFYANFASKAQLLAECFSFSVKRGAALVESRLADTSDPTERHLRRVIGTVGSQVLGADALALVRVQGMRGESDLRRPLEEAWGTVVNRIRKDLATMRPRVSSSPLVPDELTAFGLLGAFDSIYMRSMWDDTYALTDLLSAHVWLFLVVQAAMSREIDVGPRVLRYMDLVREVAGREVGIDTVLAGA